jgi:hypothetical protein
MTCWLLNRLLLWTACWRDSRVLKHLNIDIILIMGYIYHTFGAG